MPYRFEEHTAVTRESESRYRATLTDAWNIGPVPNGGYQVATACRAALDALGVPDVISAASTFISASRPGPVMLDVEVIKRGRTTSAAQVRLIQKDRETLRVMVLGGDLTALRGPELHRVEPPVLPRPETCPRISPEHGPAPVHTNEVELRPDPSTPFLRGGRGDPELCGYMRFADGCPIDSVGLTLLADAMPPTSFNPFGLTGWVPTLEMTVQVRRRPEPGWTRVRVVSRHFSAGHFEEDAEIWDESGALVAISRQRAMLLPATG